MTSKQNLVSPDFIMVDEGLTYKKVYSNNYNYYFDKKTGYFERYGKIVSEDPTMAPAPEIVDIEITTICNGVNGKVCKHCYKSNTPIGSNMSLETFKKVFNNITKTKILTQIAFGADASATANPDLFDMMEYTRSNGVIPNITVAQITPDTASKLANICGAVAVSRYPEKDACYDSIQHLVDAGMKQINIHIMVSEETYDMCMETLEDRLNDPRLAHVKAIVLLSLKTKGRGVTYHQLSQNKFNNLIQFSIDKGIMIGCDSCSAAKFLNSIEGHPNFNKIYKYVEPCESTLFSIFINYKGQATPCSFAEGCNGWQNGLDVVNCDDFVKEVWLHERMVEFRESLIKTACGNKFGCRECPLYKV
jgi:hypothetical protein